MARFVSHPLGVDLRRVFITFKPASMMTANIRKFTGGVQDGDVGSLLINQEAGGRALAVLLPVRGADGDKTDHSAQGGIVHCGDVRGAAGNLGGAKNRPCGR